MNDRFYPRARPHARRGEVEEETAEEMLLYMQELNKIREPVEGIDASQCAPSIRPERAEDTRPSQCPARLATELGRALRFDWNLA